VVDKTKLPPDLVVQRIWIPEEASEARRPIAYVSDRRRRRAGAVLIAVGVILALAALVTRTATWLAFIPLLIAWSGVAYAGGGRSGFYEVDEDGGLGEYLGRSRPEVGWMPPNEPG
jgi:uncharacterized protein YjeT (DUF2065 family)